MRSVAIIAISFLLAIVLTALPIPSWAMVWRPAWVALVLIYWCMAVPGRCGVATGWMVGLILDALLGTLMGQHALALSVVAFLTLRVHRQVRVMPVWQQTASVFVLILLYRVIVLWVNGIQGLPVRDAAYWAPALSSMLLWPWVYVLLRDIRRKYSVS